MRLLVQRVRRGAVRVQAAEVASIGRGCVVLVGVARGDTVADARYLARKTAQLRLFEDDAGRMNLPAAAVGGAFLVVSQFTLCADCSGGNRPSYTAAAPPDVAAPLYEEYVSALRQTGHVVQTGRFREHMLVEIENDGPVTLLLESSGRSAP